MGTSVLEVFRAQASVLGEDKEQESVSLKTLEYPTDSEGLREAGLQMTNVPASGGKLMLRCQCLVMLVMLNLFHTFSLCLLLFSSFK